MNYALLLAGLALLPAEADPAGAGAPDPLGPPGQRAEYVVRSLPEPPAQNVVRFTLTLGPIEGTHQWLRLSGLKQNGQVYHVWVLVDRSPLRPAHYAELDQWVVRYLFQERREPFVEYSHARTDATLLPEHRRWEVLFPRASGEGSELFPQRLHYLGFDFDRIRLERGAAPTVPLVDPIFLRPDLLIGTGRTYRDKDGGRLLNGEYEFVPVTREDMEELIQAGFNHFWVTPEQYEWIRRRGVFAVHPGGADLYPEMLYRSNLHGGHAYYDEPGHRARRHITPEDTPERMAQRVEECTLEGTPPLGSRPHRFHAYLEKREDVDLGDLVLTHPLPTWETVPSTTWYQMRAGARGVIHEGRYITCQDVPRLNAHYGCEILPWPENLLRYHYALLRGAARHFNADWGVAIYGQAERTIAPRAFTLAYDMGARYFWFWTSDRGHHVSYPEQLNLARHLTGYAAAHSRRSRSTLLHAAKVAVALPEGYTFEVRGLLYNQVDHHLERTNEHGVTHRRVLHNAAVEMERCLRQGIDFDLVIADSSFTGEGYTEAIYCRLDGTLEIVHEFHTERRSEPRNPSRPRIQDSPRLTARAEVTEGRPMPVQLTSEVAGGSPPWGFLQGTRPDTGERFFVPVVWEHYPPTGPVQVWSGPEVALFLEQAGKHRFRAVTVDANGRVAEAWVTVNVPGASS